MEKVLELAAPKTTKDFFKWWSLYEIHERTFSATVQGRHVCGSYGFDGLLWRWLLFSVLSRCLFWLWCCLSVYSPSTIIRPRPFFLSLFFLSFLCSSFFFSISQYVLYSPFVSFPEPCSIPAIIFPFFPAWHQDRRHHKQTKWIGYISSWDAVVFGRLELTRFTILLLYQAGATLPCRLYLLFLRGRFCNSFPAFCASGKKEEEKSLIWKENRFGNVAFEQAVLVSISFTCLIIGCRLAIVWLQRVNTPVDYRILPYLMTIWC